MKVIFVAGTDTGVGKTLVGAALAAAMRLQGVRVGVMKPVSCGGREDAEVLIRAAGVSDEIDTVNPVFLREPLSPNVASKREGKRIDVRAIDAAVKKISNKGYEILLMEGCGGLLVPVRDDFYVVDLIRRYKARTVLVSRSGLGAINHSLLSLEALRRRKLPVLGVIFNRLAPGALSVPEETNPGVVARLGGAPSLGVFPYLKRCESDCAGKAALKHIALERILC